jgi:hypothetical protein
MASNQGVKCEDCGELPQMNSAPVANDDVRWMLVCKCGMKGRDFKSSQFAAVREWETSGFRTAKATA